MTLWSYDEARDYAQKIGQSGVVLGLESMRSLLRNVENPQEYLNGRCIHVAGTNGKGSVIAFLSEVLVRAGYRTGVYTSPAVFEPLEVFRVNGEYISKENYVNLMWRLKDAVKRMESMGEAAPTLFELETALAFLYFKEEKCDVVLLETGLGGLEDATNCVDSPLCAVLTSISMDHMAVLGNTLEEIAAVKAGIIKEEIEVISAPQKPEVLKVLEGVCEDRHANLTVVDRGAVRVRKVRLQEEMAGDDIDGVSGRNGNELGRKICGGRGVQRFLRYKNFPDMKVGLAGEFQIENAAVALEVIQVLRKRGYHISETNVRDGIEHTCWQGRCTILSESPLLVMDGAHNEAAVEQLCKTLEEDFLDKEWILIMGVLRDKAYEHMVRRLAACVKRVLTITPDSPRALEGEVLAEIFAGSGIEAEYVGQVSSALRMAVLWCRSDNHEEDRGILVCGSFTFLREVKEQADRLMFRVNRLISHPLFLEKMEEIERLEKDRVFCGHGWEHCMDVARGAALLNEERGLGFSKELLYAMALVHDLGRGEQYLKGTPHEEASAVLAKRLLSECGFSKRETLAVSEAVLAHRVQEGKEGSLTALLIEADKRTRLCFQCQAIDRCNWSEEKKNLFLQL